MAYFFFILLSSMFLFALHYKQIKNKLGWTDFLSWIENYKATMASG